MFLLLFSFFLIAGLIPYFIRILTLFYSRTSKFDPKNSSQIQETISPETLPKMSVILPVYNEEKIIVRKIQNFLSLKYPADKLELVVVDGNSSDKTVDLVKSFKEERILLIENKKRQGVTKAAKDGVGVSTGDIVILTDTEALFDENVLMLLADDLRNPEIGAITGIEEIVNAKDNLVTQMEHTHRKFYNIFGVSESIVYSTYYFRGEFAAIRKSLFPISADDDRGILDVEISLSAIRAGFRAKCDPRIKFFGLAADRLSDRNRQKIQRATLNQECILESRDLLFLPNFYGRIIFPCTFAIHITSPILFLISVILFPLALLQLSWIVTSLLLSLLVVCSSFSKIRSLILTFVQSQAYLLIGLLKATIIGRPKFLKQVESTRRNFDPVSDRRL
jgi:cellulose synthase/poly-beta-1,6-N-acetylglucosamine synthase-like glycosyltransferase